MTPTPEQELVSALIDGELDEASARQVRELLESRPDLQELERSLRDLSKQLKAIPRRGPAADLSGKVLGLIQADGLMAKPRPVADELAAPAAGRAKGTTGYRLAIAAVLAASLAGIWLLNLPGKFPRQVEVAAGRASPDKATNSVVPKLGEMAAENSPETSASAADEAPAVAALTSGSGAAEERQNTGDAANASLDDSLPDSGGAKGMAKALQVPPAMKEALVDKAEPGQPGAVGGPDQSVELAMQKPSAASEESADHDSRPGFESAKPGEAAATGIPPAPALESQLGAVEPAPESAGAFAALMEQDLFTVELGIPESGWGAIRTSLAAVELPTTQPASSEQDWLVFEGTEQEWQIFRDNLTSQVPAAQLAAVDEESAAIDSLSRKELESDGRGAATGDFDGRADRTARGNSKSRSEPRDSVESALADRLKAGEGVEGLRYIGRSSMDPVPKKAMSFQDPRSSGMPGAGGGGRGEGGGLPPGGSSDPSAVETVRELEISGMTAGGGGMGGGGMGEGGVADGGVADGSRGGLLRKNIAPEDLDSAAAPGSPESKDKQLGRSETVDGKAEQANPENRAGLGSDSQLSDSPLEGEAGAGGGDAEAGEAGQAKAAPSQARKKWVILLRVKK